MTVTLPQDIKPQWLDIIHKWLNIARRLQSESRGQHGLAVLNICVVVNQDGKPLAWTSPKVTKLEPKASADDILPLLR